MSYDATLLALGVDSTDVKVASVDLDRLAKSSTLADAAAQKFVTSFDTSSQSIRKVGGAAGASQKILTELAKAHDLLAQSQVTAVSRALQAAQAFEKELQAMQQARVGVTALQRALDVLGGGNRDIARSILGTRSTRDIANEIQLVVSALKSLKDNASVGPLELARATEAARAKVADLRRELSGVPAASQGVASIAAPIQAIGTAASPIPGILRSFLAPLAAIASFEGVRRLVTEFYTLADANTLLQARLKNVTGSAAEGQRAFAGLAEDARQLRVSLPEAGQGFVRIALAVKELGGSVEQARQLNAVLLMTGKISGASGEEVANAARQFAQALGSGVLQGDELRSILENNQELARQLAAGLGVSIGELRKLGAEGQLTADKVANALLTRLPEIQQKLRDVPITVADAFTLLKNEVFLFIGAVDQGTGASATFAGRLENIAGGLRLIRQEFADGNIVAGLNAFGLLSTGRLDAVSDLTRFKDSAERFKESGLDARDLALQAATEKAEASALGVAASAKRAYGEVVKIQEEFQSKQQKLTQTFGENMQKIATAIDATQKVINSAPTGSSERAAAEEQMTNLLRLRSAAMVDVVKKIGDVNSADAKRSPLLKELAANTKAFNSALEQTANIAQASQEKLDQLFMPENFTKAEQALRKLENSQAWKLLTEQQKDYIRQTMLAAAETERVTKVLQDSAREAGLYANDRAKEYEAWSDAVKRSAESVDTLVEKLQAQTEALRSNGTETNEQAQALRKLKDDLDNGLIPSYDEYIIRIERVNAAFRDRDSAQAAVDLQKKVIAQQKSDYQDLFNYIDGIGRDAFAALTASGGNAAKKITEVFKSTLLALLYKLTIQPFIVNIAAVISGSGGAGGAASTLLGGGGGGLDFSKIFESFKSGTSSVSDLSYAFNNFMADLDHGISVFDAAATAWDNAAVSFGSIAGGAAVGYGVGSVANSLLGNERNKQGMEIGGMIGGIIGSFFGPIGTLIGAALGSAIGSLIKSGGGPKSGGFASSGDISSIGNTDNSGRWFTPNQSDSGIVKTLDTVNAGYASIMNALGIKAGNVGFALGFDTDPKGTAPNRTHAGAFVNGVQVYDSASGDLGRDPDVLQAQLELEAKRILFAAIKGSLGDAPQYITQLFEGIDTATATSEQIDDILNMAQALKLVVDTVSAMGDQFSAMDPAQIQALVEAFGGLQGFLESAAFLNENFTTNAEKTATITAQLNEAFAALNLGVPATHQAFLDLLASFDLTTEAGRAAYASVSALAPAFVRVNGTAQDAADAANELAAEEEQLTAARREAIDAAKDFFQANFYSEQEQAATQLDANWAIVHAAWTDMGEQLLALGLTSIPTTNAAFRTLIETLRAQGLDDLADSLVLIAPAIFGINTAIDELAESAEGAGNTISESVDTINRALERAQEAAGIARDAFAAVSSAIEDLIGQSGGNFGDKLALRLLLLGEQIKKYEQLISAEESGPNMYGPLITEYKIALQKLKEANAASAKELARFTILAAQYDAERAEAMVELESWYADMQVALAGSTEALAALKVTFYEKWQAIIDGTAGGVTDTLDEFKRLQEGIREFIDSLKLSDISPLTPTEKLAEAEKQYKDLLALAQGGDLDAMSKITGAADAYLQIAREYFASSQAYTDIFNSVLAALEGLATMEKPTAESADTALIAALPTNGKLVSAEDLKVGLQTLAGEFATSVAALAASNSADSKAEQYTVEKQTQQLTETSGATLK